MYIQKYLGNKLASTPYIATSHQDEADDQHNSLVSLVFFCYSIRSHFVDRENTKVNHIPKTM